MNTQVPLRIFFLAAFFLLAGEILQKKNISSYGRGNKDD